MKQKLLISSLLALLVFAISQTTSFALTSAAIDKMQEKASGAADRQSAELSRIQARANQMIQVRLTSLQNLLTRVQNDTKLSADEKTSFTNDINTAISGLTALKAKIDADSDVTTALADTKSIVTSYRIYVVFEPKTRLTLIIDNLQTTTNTLSDLNTKIQTLLDTLKSEGKNTTTSQNALTDAVSQVSAINALLTTDKSLLSGVNVGSTSPESVFVQVRKDLATVRADLAKIRSDYASLREDIRIILPKGTVTTKPGEASNSAQ